jgi:hypothetical protein
MTLQMLFWLFIPLYGALTGLEVSQNGFGSFVASGGNINLGSA